MSAKDKDGIDAKRRSAHGQGAQSAIGAGGEQEGQPETNPTANQGQPAAEKVEGDNRMGAAKAFYRAMYAGEDVEAEQYGMNVETVKNQTNTTTNCLNCGHVEAQLAEAQAKSAEMEGLYKRMAADFDNYRKRIDRERDEQVGRGIQKAIETILPALDDLERAQANLNNNPEMANIVESIKLIVSRFTACLEQLGIKPLEAIGQPFDPRLHEPVQQVVSAGVPPGAIVHELRRGYTLGEKVIRPSLVNVAMNNDIDQDQAGQTETVMQDSDAPSRSDNSMAHSGQRNDNNQPDASAEAAKNSQ